MKLGGDQMGIMEVTSHGNYMILWESGGDQTEAGGGGHYTVLQAETWL